MKAILCRLIPGGILALGLIAVPLFGQSITPGQQAPTLQPNPGQAALQQNALQQPQQGVPAQQPGLQQQPIQMLSRAQLREIDRLVVQLTQYTTGLSALQPSL